MTPRDYRCPRCHAAPGDLCSIGRNYYGRPAYHAHRELVADLARTLARQDNAANDGLTVVVDPATGTAPLVLVAHQDAAPRATFAWDVWRATLTADDGGTLDGVNLYGVRAAVRTMLDRVGVPA